MEGLLYHWYIFGPISWGVGKYAKMQIVRIDEDTDYYVTSMDGHHKHRVPRASLVREVNKDVNKCWWTKEELEHDSTN